MPQGPNGDRRRYLVLFFDNSTMNITDQAQARAAALKFLDNNTGTDRYIAVVDFGGTLKVTQNFTTDTARLKEVVKNLKFSAVSPTPEVASAEPVPNIGGGIPQLVDASANFGARTLLLALRNRTWQKVWQTSRAARRWSCLSSGFPLIPTDPNTVERESELTAVINTCNKANVAIYPIDVRGLTTPIGEAAPWQPFPDSAPARLVTATLNFNPDGSDDDQAPHLVYVQHSGSTGGGGGGHGGTGGGVGGTHTGGTGNTGGTRTGSTGGGRTGGTTSTSNPLPVAPYSSSRGLLPTVSDETGNKQVLYELAAGTGGFVIVNSNDLLGGLEKIANEQSRYYVLGYTPPQSEEGSCHVLKVKVDRSDTKVRSRSGYCNVRPTDLLAGKPAEKQLENQVSGSQPGNVAATMLAPYFYTSPDTARVNLAVEIPSNTVVFDKVKGKQHAVVNVLGIAYKLNGDVAARFSDQVEFNFDSKDEVDAFKKKPYRYENQFEIGAGHYNLKVAFNSGENNFGKLEMPLVVDAHDAQQFGISALALSKEVRPLSQAGNSLDAALLEDRSPLVAQGMQIVPTGSNQFKTTDLAVFYVEIYDPLLTTATPPTVGVQMVVMDRKSGQKKLETGGPAPGTSTGNPVVGVGLKLPVDKLPPGLYQLEVRGTDSAGHFTKVQTADFEVQ